MCLQPRFCESPAQHFGADTLSLVLGLHEERVPHLGLGSVGADALDCGRNFLPTCGVPLMCWFHLAVIATRYISLNA